MDSEGEEMVEFVRETKPRNPQLRSFGSDTFSASRHSFGGPPAAARTSLSAFASDGLLAAAGSKKKGRRVRLRGSIKREQRQT